jgi:ketosteroid isomerase-like protein
MRESYAAGEAVEELLALCAPDIRIDASRRVFNPDVYEGRDGLRRLVREVCDAWEGFSEREEQVIDAGERVVTLQTIGGRGRSSGVDVRAEGALLWTLRDGQVILVEVFADRAEALRLAGLDQE